jgi:DNA-binding NtrC family response regulator
MAKRILVIDDDAAVRKAFELAFDGSPYALSSVESGRLGIHRVQEDRFDLIFLDLRMPGLDGVQTLQALRQAGCDAPVYIVTSFHGEFLGQLSELARQGLEFEVLSKPVEFGQLIRVAEAALEGRVVH